MVFNAKIELEEFRTHLYTGDENRFVDAVKEFSKLYKPVQEEASISFRYTEKTSWMSSRKWQQAGFTTAWNGTGRSFATTSTSW